MVLCLRLGTGYNLIMVLGRHKFKSSFGPSSCSHRSYLSWSDTDERRISINSEFVSDPGHLNSTLTGDAGRNIMIAINS